MLVDIITCACTGAVGVGAGVVINTLRARAARKRKQSFDEQKDQLTSAPNSSHKSTKLSKHEPVVESEESLLNAYGLLKHLNQITQYIDKTSKDNLRANANLHRSLVRIVRLSRHKDTSSTHAKYWNPTGAIAINASKCKLWLRTLNLLFQARIGKELPENLLQSMQYLVDFVKAERYNRLLGQ